jgi:hypothetical protein
LKKESKKIKYHLRFKLLNGEFFKKIHSENHSYLEGISISNYGRVISFRKFPGGRLLKGSVIKGYPKLSIRDEKGTSHSVLIHHWVAKLFLKKPKKKKKNLIHLDYNKKNNHYKNLKWVSEKGFRKHHAKNPKIALKKPEEKISHSTLSPSKVKMLKRELLNENVNKTALAKKYKISVTQVHRIHNGTHWGHIRV